MFYVTEETECPACGGQGVVTHPAWELYYREHGDLGILNEDGLPDMALDVAWFQKQGYDYPPDEEVPCWECEGSGLIRREVELVAALDTLRGAGQTLSPSARGAEGPKQGKTSHTQTYCSTRVL